MTKDIGPLEQLIREKLTRELAPISLKVLNESHLHAHHLAVRDLSPDQKRETHFNVHIVSDNFKQRTQMQRHRLVYSILDEEIKKGGVHALSMVTRTSEEQQKLDKK